MSATREDYDVFFQTCYAIFNRHKLDYLTNRLNVFAHGTNLLNTNYLTGDAFNTVAKRFQLDEKYFLAPYRDVIIDLTLGVTHHIAVASDFLRTIFFSLAPHFLIFLFLLFNFKRLYSELVLATWVFLRLPILFFLEPASIFKYYYAIYFCFIFLAIQIFLSHKAKKNPL
ncbi:MAG: hypothetical protein H7256_10440 [Bdellovibrio sp.]|nr:hypothetical protein [Bdellovibrio sp.]